MTGNELLEEKWNVQKKMAKEANYNIKCMLDNAEKIVNEMIVEYGIIIKEANLKPDNDFSRENILNCL